MNGPVWAQRMVSVGWSLAGAAAVALIILTVVKSVIR